MQYLKLAGIDTKNMLSEKGRIDQLVSINKNLKEENLKLNAETEFMKKHGIECRHMINPVHHAEQFKDQYSDCTFKISENISKKSLHLPSGTSLRKSDIQYITDTLKSFFI